MNPLPLPAGAKRRRLGAVLGAAAYVRRGRARCFVCATVAGDPGYPHHLVHEDASSLAFLAKGTTLWGHVLVAPKEHLEHVTGDVDADAYAELQRVVHRVGEAVRRAVPCERLYVLSLGSQQLNRHVHWHVAPCPPGLPLSRQQFRAFSKVLTGVLELPESSWASLAAAIRAELEGGA